jgi:prepilin-type processing-associated H-X9-DG protein
MDFLEIDPNTLTGNDFDQVEQGRHSATAKRSGGSNYAFADGADAATSGIGDRSSRSTCGA